MAVVGAAVLGAACSSDSAAQPTATATEPQAQPTATATEPLATVAAPSRTPVVQSFATATPEPYDTSRVMYRLFIDVILAPERVDELLSQIRDNNDVALVPVVAETMRFVVYRDLLADFGSTLRELTGSDMPADNWHEWMEWLGQHRDDFPPPDEYAEWKRQSLAQIHPRFVEMLASAEETSRIELTEVVWGGVAPDGIPDLLDPPSISAEEAGYLLPDDRVVGVIVNGDGRAYPLRILNPHEMVNDVLGGEPISLVW